MDGAWDESPQSGWHCLGSPGAVPSACKLIDGDAALDSFDAFLDAFAEDCESPTQWPGSEQPQEFTTSLAVADGGLEQSAGCLAGRVDPAELRAPVAVTQAAHATMSARMHQPPATRAERQSSHIEPASSTDASATCNTHASCGTPERDRGNGGSTANSRLQGPSLLRARIAPRCGPASNVVRASCCAAQPSCTIFGMWGV